MRQLRTFWRTIFDVRPGEGLRILFMALHMTCVLFAYYILKPVSRALFLSKFDIDQLPYLYVLIAAVGGILAFAYTRIAVRSSLMRAVNWATAVVIVSLLAIWWLLRFDFNWMLYVFNIWVSLFSAITVAQGWLVAANVFDSREAKRLYGLLGLSGTVGAAFGGEFTARLAKIMEPRDLLLATAGMVMLAYGFVLAVASLKNVNLAKARAAGDEEAESFAFRDILDGIRKHRHLQVIMAIIMITFVVDVMVEFQFSAMAKASYHSKADLTSFLGNFYGLYLNMATFVIQLLLTAMIVRYLGVGGTLQIMPVVIGIASTVMIFVPKLAAASVLRLSEAATRYSFNRTGMELLYLPLPTALKNRTKAFVDIFMDRFGRGVGAMVLMGYLAFEKNPKHPSLVHISALILTISICWVMLSARVSREYLATIRKRLESRRLDFSETRITVADPDTIAMLEKTIETGTPRQAAYALTLLGDTPSYDCGPLVEALARHASTECRTAAYEVAANADYAGLIGLAVAAIERAPETGISLRERQAIATYLVKESPGAPLNDAWVLAEAADSAAPWRRSLSAYVIGLSGPESGTGDGVLRLLLDDPDPGVASAACRAAGKTGDRVCFEHMVQRLNDHAVRGTAIESLAMYGSRVCGSLGDILNDERAPVAIRRQVPRVLRLIHDQRSVEVLMAATGCAEPTIRTAVVKALNRLRESAPTLQYGSPVVGQRIQTQATACLRLNAQLLPLKPVGQPGVATGLLVRTLECRLREAREELFRLLGLRYPPIEIYNAFLALESGDSERAIAAQDYLDSILDRDVKHILMPLLESTERVASHARESFPEDARSAEKAISGLLRSGDSWLTTCAMAAAAELNLKGVADEISKAGELFGKDARTVAGKAAAALA